MIKKILLLLNIGIICLIISQFLIIEFDESDRKKIEEKAFKILKKNKNYTEENLYNLTKDIQKKEAYARLKAVKIRKFVYDLNENDRLQLSEYLEKQSLDKEPDKNLQIKILQTGYSPITYINERIFSLTSYKQLKFSKNYFIIILSITSFLIVSILFFYFKKRDNSKI